MSRSRRVLLGAALVVASLIPWIRPVDVKAEGASHVQGVVITMSRHGLTLQTRTGSMTVPITPRTRIIREMTGSTVDLAPKEFVTYGDDPDGGVDWIHILVPPPPPGGRHDSHGAQIVKPRSGTRKPAISGNHGPRHGLKPSSPDRPYPRHAVRLVAVSPSVMTVRYGDGHTATIQIDADVLVIKDLRGQRGDLAMGEMVNVQINRAGNAAQITILSD